MRSADDVQPGDSASAQDENGNPQDGEASRTMQDGGSNVGSATSPTRKAKSKASPKKKRGKKSGVVDAAVVEIVDSLDIFKEGKDTFNDGRDMQVLQGEQAHTITK